MLECELYRYLQPGFCDLFVCLFAFVFQDRVYAALAVLELRQGYSQTLQGWPPSALRLKPQLAPAWVLDVLHETGSHLASNLICSQR